MPFKSLIIEYLTASEKTDYIRENHTCGCKWEEDYDCDECAIAHKLNEAEDAPAYFRYLEYRACCDLAKMQKEGYPIRYFVTEEMKDDDVLVEIVVEEDDRKCES